MYLLLYMYSIMDLTASLIFCDYSYHSGLGNDQRKLLPVGAESLMTELCSMELKRFKLFAL